jgi:hypothetical protein
VQGLARIEVDRFERQLAGFDLREVEDVVDDRDQAVGRALDLLGVLTLLGGQGGFEQQAGGADDAVHRGADLVADRGQESALGLGRIERGVARGGQLPLHLAPALDLLPQVVVDAAGGLGPLAALLDEVGAESRDDAEQQPDAEDDLGQRRIGRHEPAAAAPGAQAP